MAICITESNSLNTTTSKTTTNTKSIHLSSKLLLPAELGVGHNPSGYYKRVAAQPLSLQLRLSRNGGNVNPNWSRFAKYHLCRRFGRTRILTMANPTIKLWYEIMICFPG
ncbi:unnamed protein product [Clavelina lepadiformis]|uniref:Uncharacterized protein n=1 Tax=Clavelina lepadiformis TaxID=159417 RepID=A0ABP0GCT9_CLALP